MKHVQIRSPIGNSKIIVDESVTNLKNYLKPKNHVIITDKNVHALYGHLFSEGRVVVIEPGEGAKTLKTVEAIYKKFLEFEIDRSACVVGIGGGVVCDITGFSASTYMRGIPFGFVPSTLLAQVDAGIGGKNGVNLNGYKNVIGVFQQPCFVLLDFEFLKTLPDMELRCGLAEIIKHALIESPSLFRYLEKEWKGLLFLKDEMVERAVLKSILIKTKIVRADALEHGSRRKLNFGHTLGHAIEKTSGLRHGEAISIGMVIASHLSLAKGMLSKEEATRIRRLLENVKLPTQLSSINKKSILDAIKRDKKRQNKKIFFVLLSGIGRAEVVKTSYGELEEQINDLCQPW